MILPGFIVGEKSVRNPDFVSEVAGQVEEFVFGTEGQSLVLPVLVEVHRDCVVLERTCASYFI